MLSQKVRLAIGQFMRNARMHLNMSNNFNRKVTSWSILTLWLFVAMLIQLPFMSGNASAASKEQSFIPLQPIINAMNPGEELTLKPGMYLGPVTIDKSISLLGDSSVMIVSTDTSSIQSASTNSPESTININGDGVKLQGFTILHQHSTPTAAIQVEANHAEIKDIHIQTQGFGILARDASEGTFRENVITWTGSETASSSQKGNGIDLYNAHRNHIEGNEIRGMLDGIYMENSREATVKGNTLLHTRYGIHCMYVDGSYVLDNIGEDNITGAMIMGVKNTTVSGNSFRKQSENVHSQGILLYDVHQSSIVNNIVEGNRVGMNIAESAGNDIRGNEVLRNFIGFQLVLAEGNRLHQNQFISNVIDASAVDSRNNEMSSNYWDSFRGLDLNGDGVSEMAYGINPFYEQLISRNSAYQLFFQSPGMVFLSELYTEGKENWSTDQSPLMTTMTMEPQQQPGTTNDTIPVWVIGVILLCISACIMIYSGGLRK
ncbi:nitrous oxide reductase family maturation protein NosD [Paenibacillus xylanexedens]|uniref:right-handed parallel beta-helix repeat-containing protein n=1 Tax=Paenibacillus xylanexedens TaxID=528191 RepID=UPI0021B60223|nr:NosD domain-containing protein [Paenibacillus xylanexedens]